MEKVIYQTYEHWYERMTHFIQENKNITSCDVCFAGDSIIEMAPIQDNCPKQKVFVNRGIISDKSAGLLMSLQDRVLALHPKTIFIFIGTNDICDGYSLNQIKQNYQDIIEMIHTQDKSCHIIFSTITPPCYYEANHVENIYPECRDITRLLGLNEIIRKLPETYSNVSVFDSFYCVADENNSLKIEDTIDGVHLSKSAYNKIAKELFKLF